MEKTLLQKKLVETMLPIREAVRREASSLDPMQLVERGNYEGDQERMKLHNRASLDSEESSTSQRSHNSNPRQEIRHLMHSYCNSITDSGVRNSNKHYWLKNEKEEALKLWAIGKQLGVNYKGCVEEIVRILMELEKRDDSEFNGVPKDGREFGAK